jgi:hypothetical protein
MVDLLEGYEKKEGEKLITLTNLRQKATAFLTSPVLPKEAYKAVFEASHALDDEDKNQCFSFVQRNMLQFFRALHPTSRVPATIKICIKAGYIAEEEVKALNLTQQHYEIISISSIHNLLVLGDLGLATAITFKVGSKRVLGLGSSIE